jgi:hypothetical protein
MSVTPAELENAMRVVREGKASHGLYAYEDALDIVKDAARLSWRQSAVLTAFMGLSAGLTSFFIGHDLVITLIAVTVGMLLAYLTIHAPPLRALFAPQGLSAGDVAKASSCAVRAS